MYFTVKYCYILLENFQMVNHWAFIKIIVILWNKIIKQNRKNIVILYIL